MKNEQATQVQQMTSLWWEMWEEQAARSAAHAQVAIEESARMAKESITYGHKLANEWRKIVIGSTPQV